MSNRGIVVDETEDARLARAELRIEEFRGFLHDVIDDPTVLDLVPDGSSLEVRRVSIAERSFRLTAYRPTDSVGHWSARVTSYLGETPSGLPLENANGPVMWSENARLLPGVDDIIRTGETAAAALDALHERLAEIPF